MTIGTDFAEYEKQNATEMRCKTKHMHLFCITRELHYLCNG